MRSVRHTGFTLVELLIVIVVIATLAAISIVSYNGIQERAYDAAVRSDASTIQKKLELQRITLGHFPASLADMPDLTVSKDAYDISNNNVYYCYNAADQLYAVSLRSKSDTTYVVSNSGIEEVSGVQLAAATCTRANTTWADRDRDAGWIGYTSSSSTWNTSWSWTNS